MVQFCTNCGTKLEKDALFCINCGRKVGESGEKGKISLFETRPNNKEKKEAKKELKKVVGGRLSYNETFSNKLSENGLDVITTGKSIKEQVEKEIESGQIKSKDIENRVNELIVEYKNIADKKKENLKVIEELLESEENKSKIKEYNISGSQLNSIKNNVQDKIENTPQEYLNKGKIKKYLNAELKKEIKKNKIKKESGNNNIKQETKKNAFEKLYDFEGVLIGEGKFVNIGIFHRKIVKNPGKRLKVFFKVYEDNMKIMERIGYAGENMTLFFNDINRIGFDSGGIGFDERGIDLILNNEKYKIVETNKPTYVDDGKNIKDFYKLLHNAWEKFKSHENNQKTSISEKEENTSTDELIKYAELYEKGLLTEEEFNAAKKKLLGL